MGKGKQGKVVSMPQTPENYFKSGRARKLPVHECLISDDWKDEGIVNILLSRKHVNGNISWAVYLVDTYCLGIRDTDYAFNQPEEDYDECKSEYVEDYDLVPCSYSLIHNVIYGAVAYAATYDLKPCKDFSVSRFLLKEEDGERIKKMTIEFGFEGKPTYMASSREDNIERIIASLERNPGKGNFRVMIDDEDDDQDDWHGNVDIWDDVEDNDDRDDEENENGLFQKGEMEDIMNGKKEPNPFQAFVMAQDVYEDFFSEEGNTPAIKKMTKGLDRELIMLIGRMTVNNPAYCPQVENGSKESVLTMPNERTPEQGIIMVERSILEHPYVYDLYQLRLLLAKHANIPPSDALFDRFYKLFPGHPLSKILRAAQLISMGKPEDAFDTLNRKYCLTEAFPENRGVFSTMEIFSFYAVLCRYYAAVDNVAASLIFANRLIDIGGMPNLSAILAATEVVEKIMKEVDEKGLSEE